MTGQRVLLSDLMLPEPQGVQPRCKVCICTVLKYNRCKFICHRYYCEGLTGAGKLGYPWATCLKVDPNCGQKGDPWST